MYRVCVRYIATDDTEAEFHGDSNTEILAEEDSLGASVWGDVFTFIVPMERLVSIRITKDPTDG